MKAPMTFDLFNPASENQSAILPPFSNLKNKINGLKYVSDFISKEEEFELLKIINDQEWLGDLKRRVQHYGWKYDYRARSLNSNMHLGSLPNWIKKYADRLFEQKLIDVLPDQVIINEYKPGQGIANHVDCEPCFGDTIISLSLATPCVMNFINLNSKNKVEILLEPRSVVSIKDDSRYLWSHGIPARLADEINGNRVNRKLRISMTFRKVII